MIIANHLGQLGPVRRFPFAPSPEPEDQGPPIAPLRVVAASPAIVEPPSLPPGQLTPAPPGVAPTTPPPTPPLPTPTPTFPTFPTVDPFAPAPAIQPALGPPAERAIGKCPLWVWFLIGGGTLAAGYFILKK